MQQNRILPGSTIGIIGGGQLGRMMAVAAKHMGYRIVVLDPTPDCPTAQVSDDHIVANYDDMDAIKKLAELSDVITYEFENVDLTAARYLEEKGLLPQGAELLDITQDREHEKNTMVKHGLPVAPFAIVNGMDEFAQAALEMGVPCVAKTCRGGYDGKGQQKFDEDTDALALLFFKENKRYIAEKWIDFDKEISVIFTRAQNGEITFFPLAENVHKNHILDKTIVPALVCDKIKEKALEAARLLADGIGVVGTFAIEMFVSGDNIYINEMAPRPHNSGHYTIESCNVSQFEQHIRAICGLPLLPIEFQGASIMVNLIGEDLTDCFARIDELTGAHIHVYGKKEIKPKRKMGHVTYVGTDLNELQQLVEEQWKDITAKA